MLIHLSLLGTHPQCPSVSHPWGPAIPLALGGGPAREPPDGGSSLRPCPCSCTPRLSPTEPRRASRSQVRAWSWRRYSLASCLAALKASACRVAASVRSANWDRGHVPWDGTTGQECVLVAHSVGTQPCSAPQQGHGPRNTWQGETSLAQVGTAEIPNPAHHPTPGDQPQTRDGDILRGDSQPIHLWGNQLPLTLDLYHSSVSWTLLAAMASYWLRMSRRAAVRSGLLVSTSTCTRCRASCSCSSRSSCGDRGVRAAP